MHRSSHYHPISRRAFLRWLAYGSTAVAGSSFLAACAALSQPTVVRGPTGEFVPDLEFELRALASAMPVLGSPETNVLSYAGRLIKGAEDQVSAIPQSYLGPVVRARTGDRVRATFINDLPGDNDDSIVHWHGLIVPEEMDGHPSDVIKPKSSYTYEFEVLNRAGTYWFHPHPHGQTGYQAYMGLAGLFLVSDDEEQALDLPRGDYDVPLVIQDRVIDADNQFAYLGSSGMMGGMPGMDGMAGMDHGMGQTAGGDMMSQVMGMLGDRILVNGRADFVLSAATRVYRLRLLNGSNARIYKLGWSDDRPMIVIATDGGLLERPVEKPYVMLAPGERIELWADFSAMPAGTQIALNSLAYSGAEDADSMGHMMSSAPPLGAPLELLKVLIDREEMEPLTLPDRLTTLERLDPAQAVNADQPRRIEFSFRNMRWLINGKQFEMAAVALDEKVQVGTVEIWELVNLLNPGEMMDANGMAHPFHLHGVQFQVIGRDVLPELNAGWETVREGYVDEGWKDTVMLMPGERVRLAVRFGPYTGVFAFHCHNLEHSDQGMMRNYQIQ